MRRAAYRLAASGAALLLIAVLGVTWLAATSSGLRLARNVLERLGSGAVEIATLEGRLVGPLAATGIVIELAGFRIAIERAEAEWRALTAFAGTFDVDYLRVRGVEITRVPDAAAARPAGREPVTLPASLTPPVVLQMRSFSADDVTLWSGLAMDPFELDRVSFGLRLDPETLAVDAIEIRAAALDADGRISITPRGDYATVGEIAWTYRLTDYPAIRGATSVSGTLAALTIEQRLEPPYALDAALRVTEALVEPAVTGAITLRFVPAELGLDLPLEHIAGRLAVDGGVADLAVSGELELTAPELADSRLDFDVRYADEALLVESLQLVRLDGPGALELAGTLSVDPELAYELAGTWTDLGWPLTGPPTVTARAGSIELTGNLGELRAVLETRLAGGFVEGSATLDGERVQADLAWEQLVWPEADPRLASERGMLSVEGTPADYRLTLEAELAAVAAPAADGHLRASGRGDTRSVALENVSIAVLDGTVSGSGALTWDPAVAATVDLVLADLDPGLFGAWSGRVGGRVEAGVTISNGAISVDAGDVALAGTLRERPFALTASGRYEAPATAQVERLELRYGGTMAGARGVVGPELDFAWDVDSTSLEGLWPGLAGALATSGQVSGPRARPLVTLHGTGAGLALDDVRVGELELTARVDLSGSADSRLVLMLRDAVVADRAVSVLDVSAAGNAASHALKAVLATEVVNGDFALTGSIARAWQSDFAWTLALDEATLTSPVAGEWRLREPASAHLTGTGAELDAACWSSQDASLCLQGTYADQRMTGRFDLTTLPLPMFAAYFPTGTSVTGTLDGGGSFVLSPAALPLLDIELATSRGWIGPSGASESDAGLTFAPGRARATWNTERLGVEIALPLLSGDGGIDVRATAERSADPGATFTESAVAGDVRLTIADIAFVPDVIPGITDATGSLAADLSLAGTLGAPRLLGRIELADAQARLSEPGIELEQVRLVLTADGSGNIGLTAAASSGGGQLDATGSLRLERGLAVGQIDLVGERFEILSSPTATVLASPDLRLDLRPDHAELMGTVLVPSARITPRETTEGVARVSADQVIVDADRELRVVRTRPLAARIELELGDDVRFDGFGLTGRLAGALEIIETTAEPASGTGELRIEQGTYEAYRQRLEIRTGRLLFAGGPLARPGLDIEAVRRPADDILVGARVRGTLERPELIVFSEPAMPRQEQLSYLLLGRPLERTSASESSAMSRAAVVLGLSGGDFVTDRLNRSLGFDEFGFQTESGETDATSFVIGRYLAPSLYVSYGIGLFEAINTLRLRYTITNRWRFETESSSEASGGDVIFHIERGE